MIFDKNYILDTSYLLNITNQIRGVPSGHLRQLIYRDLVFEVIPSWNRCMKTKQFDKVKLIVGCMYQNDPPSNRIDDYEIDYQNILEL